MNRPWLPWMLAGALVASLSWNIRLYATMPGPAGGLAGAPSARDAELIDVLHRLSLTGDQMQRIVESCEDCCLDLGSIRDSWSAHQEELRDALRHGTSDPEQVLAIGRKLADLSGMRTMLSVEAALRMCQALDADQRVVLSGCCAAGEGPAGCVEDRSGRRE